MELLTVERLDSRGASYGQNPSATLGYYVSGTTDGNLAYALVNAAAPVLYNNLVKQNVQVNPGEGPDFWRGDVQYGIRKLSEPGDNSWQFELGGENIHITHSLSTPHKYAASGTAQDFETAINVSSDGTKVEGTDIEGKSFSWSETHCIAYANFTSAYLGILFNLKSKVNDSAWRIWSAGEVLFRGVSGSAKGEDMVSLTFRFAASPNKTGLTVGSITGIAKKGWEYLWVLYEDKEDATANALVKRPKAVYIEKVYEDGDFSDLGIYDPWN